MTDAPPVHPLLSPRTSATGRAGDLMLAGYPVGRVDRGRHRLGALLSPGDIGIFATVGPIGDRLMARPFRTGHQ